MSTRVQTPWGEGQCQVTETGRGEGQPREDWNY